LLAWKQLVQESELDCFDSFLSTLDKRLDEITNYFVARKNSGFVEGLNNKIKVIKRRCYGIFNVGHLFQRLFIDLAGYEQFA
jgi:transposase